jgi:hypothetical protein
MKSKLPVLEYSVAGTTPGKKGQWAFKFRTPEGDLLMESAMGFGSQAEAERAFVSLIKRVAANEYHVQCPQSSGHEVSSARRPNGRCGLMRRRRLVPLEDGLP